MPKAIPTKALGRMAKPSRTVCEVHSVARAHNHEVAEDDKAPDADRKRYVLKERNQQIASFRKRNRGKTALHPLKHQTPDVFIARRRNRESQVDGGNDADKRLPEELFSGLHALGIVMDYLSVVIDPADGAEA